jgi:hypothetical protein
VTHTLTENERLAAHYISEVRQERNRKAGKKDLKYSTVVGIESAGHQAEVAFGHLFGLEPYWGTVKPKHDHDFDWNGWKADVKSTVDVSRNALLVPTTAQRKDIDIYVLMIGDPATGAWDYKGWAWWKEIFEEAERRPMKCWTCVVPLEKLHQEPPPQKP